MWELSAKLLFLSQRGGENVKAENVDSHFHHHAGNIDYDWLVFGVSTTDSETLL